MQIRCGKIEVREYAGQHHPRIFTKLGSYPLDQLFTQLIGVGQSLDRTFIDSSFFCSTDPPESLDIDTSRLLVLTSHGGYPHINRVILGVNVSYILPMKIATETALALGVLVVEDENFSRTILSESLIAGGLRVVGSASNAQAAMKLFQLHHPDVVTLDLDLGDGPTGIDIAYAMREKDSSVGIVILSSLPDPRLLRPNLRPVPPHVIYQQKSKVDTPEALMRSIHEAIQAIANAGDKKASRNNGAQHQTPFTDTQIEFMRLIALGLSNTEISKRRFITVKSTENSIARLAKILHLEQDETINQRVQIARTYFRLIKGI